MTNKINNKNIKFESIEPFIRDNKLSSKEGVRTIDVYINQLALLRFQESYPESHKDLRTLLKAHDSHYLTHYSGIQGWLRKLASSISNAWNKQGWNTTYTLQNKAIRAELIRYEEHIAQKELSRNLSKMLFVSATQAKKMAQEMEKNMNEQRAAEQAKAKPAHRFEFIDLSSMAAVQPEPTHTELPVKVQPEPPPPSLGTRVANYFFALLSPLPPPKYDELIPRQRQQGEAQPEPQPETEPLPPPPVEPPPAPPNPEPKVEAPKPKPVPAPNTGIALINEALLARKPNSAALAATVYLNAFFQNVQVAEVVPGKAGEFIIKLEKPLKTVFEGATVNLAKELTLVANQQDDNQLVLQFTKGFTAKFYFTINAPPITITPTEDIMDTQFSASLFKITATWPLSRCLSILNRIKWS